MITIYHNPRCQKSREGIKALEASGQEFEVREYLKKPFTEKELSSLLQKLNFAPIELVRTDEKIWKDEYSDRDLNDDELIRVMIENPKLIQRPIVEKDGKAVVGRPIENIEKLLN